MQSDLLGMIRALSITDLLVPVQSMCAMGARAHFIVSNVQALLSECIGKTAQDLSIEPAIMRAYSRSFKTQSKS